ncbi:protein SRC2 homolog [Pyrus x bretschneideri]|uniref:protein SRC2 homolog n=1 Tax=Pyrus x bretschneideri TaxID=225117 RepID=UPI0020303FAC|nr:protein SRC2 homolog [Pyrus x bretschneideri]
MSTAEKIGHLKDCSSIELKVISCKDLSAFNFFNRLSVYAAVSIFNDEVKKEEQKKHLQQRQKTPVDREGDCNPEWNHPMQFDTKDLSLVDEFDNLFVEFDIRCDSVFGKKSIGKVRVPFADLIDDQCNEAVRFVSYQVRTSDGKPNGVLNFSYKVIKKNTKVGIHDSQESDSSSKLTTASVYPDPADNTVQSLYPTLDVQVQSRDINVSYPSLSDVRAPLPTISVPSPKFNCHWRPEPYNMKTLPSQLPFSPPATGPAGANCHPCQPLPFAQPPTPRPYFGNYSCYENPTGT